MAETKTDEVPKLAVNRRQMVDELVGKLGAQGTLLLWEFLIEIKTEDSFDAMLLRRMKEEYLNSPDWGGAGFIIDILRQWESNPAHPKLAEFLFSMREITAFRHAEKAAEMLQGYNEPARIKILDAVKVLRELFAGTLVQINLKDMPIN